MKSPYDGLPDDARDQTIDGLLANARQTDADGVDIDADALFARISHALGDPTSGAPDLQDDVETTPAHEEPATVSSTTTAQPRRGLATALTLAAAALVLLGIGYLLGGARTTPTEPTAVALTDQDAPSAPEPGAPVANEPAATLAVATNTDGAPTASQPPNSPWNLGELGGRSLAHADVVVLPSRDAAWTFTAGLPHQLTLERGTVLVEYAPDATEGLTIAAGDHVVRVTGTIVTVQLDADGVSVAVVDGSVEVEAPAHTVGLHGGRQLLADGRLQALDPAVYQLADVTFGVAAHQARRTAVDDPTPTTANDVAPAPVLTARNNATASPARRNSAATQNETATDAASIGGNEQGNEDQLATLAHAAPAPTVEQTVTELRTLADQAAAAGRWTQAALHYEELVSRAPANSADRAVALLELSRLYTHRLQRDDRARRAMRTFLRDHSADPAAAQVRTQLCRSAQRTGIYEPACR